MTISQREARRLRKRVEELEADIAGSLESGRISSKSGAPPKSAERKVAQERGAFQERQSEGKEVSVEEAFEAAGI